MFSMAKLQAHVDQLNEEFAEATWRAREWRNTEFTARIEPDLGRVTVRRTGELVAVELRSYRVTHYSGAELGRAVREAIRRAEEHLR